MSGDDPCLIIRHVTVADAGAWERMREALWPGDPHARDIAAFFADIAPEPAAVLVAVPSSSDAPVAFIELSERRDLPDTDGASTGYVEGLYVDPSHRTGGLTRRLLRAARRWAQERGCSFFASDRDDRVIFDRTYRLHAHNNVPASYLILWRDSVCMADDCDAPHELTLPAADRTLRGVVADLLRASYLAAIAGGRATWILETGDREGRPLAVLAQQWRHPRFLVEPDEMVSTYVRSDAIPHLHLRYWCQVDPERVFGCLQRGEPPPDRYGR